MPAAGNAVAGWLERLHGLGLRLPEPPTPLGSYATAAQAGGLLFLSGMLPLVNGKLAVKGRIGADLTIAQGREAALIALLNGLAVARRFAIVADRIERVVRLGVAIAAIPDFSQHATVADGASETLEKLFAGEPGHVRLVSGVQSLALGAPVALEIILAVRERRPQGREATHGAGTGATRSRSAPGLETAPMRRGPATGGLWI